MSEDLKLLRAQSLRAREYTHELGPRTYTLRVPTAYEWRRIMVGNAADAVAAQRALLEDAVIGWEGVTAADLFPGEAEPEPAAFDRLALACLLDNNLAESDALAQRLIGAYNERRARIEATAKN
jgi:hypothetical protein